MCLQKDFTMLSTLSNQDNVTEEEFGHALVQVFASSVVMLTAIEVFLVTWLRGPWTVPTKLLVTTNGHWLLIPGLCLVGLISRPLGRMRYLPLLAAVVTLYTFVSQFRGIWIWLGTFDKFSQSQTGWTLSLAIGLVVAVLVGFKKEIPKVNRAATSYWLLLLAASLAVLTYSSRWMPVDSEFAFTRPIATVVTIIVLSIVAVWAWRSE